MLHLLYNIVLFTFAVFQDTKIVEKSKALRSLNIHRLATQRKHVRYVRGGYRSKSDGCRRHLVVKPAEQGGPGTKALATFLGTTPFISIESLNLIWKINDNFCNTFHNMNSLNFLFH